MPVECAKRGDKYRIVGPDGRIEETASGRPRDGGGHETEAECQRQMRAINEGEDRRKRLKDRQDPRKQR